MATSNDTLVSQCCVNFSYLELGTEISRALGLTPYLYQSFKVSMAQKKSKEGGFFLAKFTGVTSKIKINIMVILFSMLL